MFLAKFGKDHVLFDAGAPGKEYADFLLPSLETALGDGQLRLVALTHGHSDHVGALEALVQEYPDVQVVFHQDEATYITGQCAHPVLEPQCCKLLTRHASRLVCCPRRVATPSTVCEQAKDPPFTVCAGKVPYDEVPSDHDKYNVTMFDLDVSSALSKERVLYVRGGCQSFLIYCVLCMWQYWRCAYEALS